MAARFDKFTVKAQEAVQAAQSIADQLSHQAIEPEHLLLALIQQQEGVVSPLLAKLGAPADAIRRQVEAELAKAPKVRGGTGAYGTPRLRAIFEREAPTARRASGRSSSGPSRRPNGSATSTSRPSIC